MINNSLVFKLSLIFNRAQADLNVDTKIAEIQRRRREIHCFDFGHEPVYIFSQAKFQHFHSFQFSDWLAYSKNPYKEPPGGGGTRNDFDRDARVIYLGLKFHNLLFFGGCSK